MAENRTHESIVIGIFNNAEEAEQTVEALHDAEFTTDQIRYSRQFTREDFFQSIKDMLIFPNERQDESESDVETMLLNMGFEREELRFYNDEIEKKRPIIIVRPDGRNQEVEAILLAHHASGYREQ